MSNETTARPAWLQAGAECVTRDGRRAKVVAQHGGFFVAMVPHEPPSIRVPFAALLYFENGTNVGTEDRSRACDLVGPYIAPPSMDESALPAWAEWYAMDKSGVWWWYSADVKIIGCSWSFADYIEPDDVSYAGTIPPAYAPKWAGDWRNSKVRVRRNGGSK